VRIAIVSDTHMPRGARAVPEPCVEALRSADLIVHAGDFSSVEVLGWIESLGPPVHAVYGNVDTAEVRERLSEAIEFDAAGIRIAVVHDAGPAKGRLARMRRRFPDANAVIFGHSHLPLHEEEDGFHIFNPGSPTERRRAPRHSFGIAEVNRGELELCHVWLSPE
jgi:putative phosphoesterase